MLDATILLEFALAKWLDATIILAVLTLNTVLGIFQEKRAEAAVDLLRTRLEINARVLRDGTWTLLPASRLVPGDVIHIRVGDFVPADVAVQTGTILADQSALTGESMPVSRGPESTVFRCHRPRPRWSGAAGPSAWPRAPRTSLRPWPVNSRQRR
jgi:H+-transporting ATPase